MLSNFTTFRIGGPAKFFTEVGSEEDLLKAIEYAESNNLKFFILGGGSNILVNDKGFDGLIIKFKVQSSKFKIQEQNSQPKAGPPRAEKLLINCWAGDSLSGLVNFATLNSLTGLEWAAGIPGTIGGAIHGNARAFGRSMSDNIINVRVINLAGDSRDKNIKNQRSKIKNCHYDMRISNFNKNECHFGYGESVFKQNNNLIIISANIQLQPGNKEESQRQVREIISKRVSVQPKGFPSAGSFFLNPVVKNKELRKKFEDDKGIKCKDDKLPAGWLIDQAGLRGKKIGGVMISEKHANFVINSCAATAEDVIMLASLIKQQVRDKFGVELQEEVQYVGF